MDIAEPVVSRRRLLLTGLGAVVGSVAVPLPAVAADLRRRRRICRAAWGAAEPTGDYQRHRIKRLTVHHSAVALRDNRKAPRRFRRHQAAHQGLGWPDIAYHLLIDRRGHIYRGRPIWAEGDTGTNYDPRGHLLVLCEGNFEVQSPSRRQVRALVDVLAWAAVTYDVPLRRIKGHRDHASTACPGEALYALLEDGTVRRRVRRRIKAGGVSLRTLCGDAADDLIDRIVSSDA